MVNMRFDYPPEFLYSPPARCLRVTLDDGWAADLLAETDADITPAILRTIADKVEEHMNRSRE
jgi:hypothetical protein